MYRTALELILDNITEDNGCRKIVITGDNVDRLIHLVTPRQRSGSKVSMPLLNALMAVDGTTHQESTRVGYYMKLIKQLIAVTPDLTPEEINRRLELFKRKYSYFKVFTAGSLVNHWGELNAAQEPQRPPVPMY